jgi:hypothetical protein
VFRIFKNWKILDRGDARFKGHLPRWKFHKGMDSPIRFAGRYGIRILLAAQRNFIYPSVTRVIGVMRRRALVLIPIFTIGPLPFRGGSQEEPSCFATIETADCIRSRIGV